MPRAARDYLLEAERQIGERAGDVGLGI